MRILYGISGDGLGHAMRARVVAAHLVSQGHDVRIATSGRAAAVLRKHGFAVVDVRCLTSHYERGGVERGKTVLRLVRETPERLRHNVTLALEEAVAFAPDVVLTDFNGFACAVGHVSSRPVVSFDHQHVLDRYEHPWSMVVPFAVDFAIARAAVRVKTLSCARYVVTSFYFPEPRPRAERSTRIVGPVMRPEIEHLVPTDGDHVVVYQTAEGDPRLLPALMAIPRVPFKVYGHGRPRRVANVELCPFDEAGFLSSLASARAVIANGGFTTISEALYLGKPVLSIPLARQAEQQLNAAWLEALGLGARAPRATVAAIRRFLDRLPDCGRATQRDARLRSGTRDALLTVDRVLAEVA